MNCYIKCYSDSKIPVGKDWAAHPLSAEEVVQRLANNPSAKYDDLLAHIKDHRLALAMAALSPPAGYIKAGRPDMKLSGV